MSAIPQKAEVIHAVYDGQGNSRDLDQNSNEPEEVEFDPNADLDDDASEDLAALKMTPISAANRRGNDGFGAVIFTRNWPSQPIRTG